MIYVVELALVNLVGGVLFLCYILVSRIVIGVASHRCMLVITLLLHMLYVIGFFYSLVLMVRYCRHYTIVTYDLCGLLVLHGISGRAFAAI